MEITNKEYLKLKRLEKIIHDYCYISNDGYGDVIKMCCEENEESNTNDFMFLKEVLENE